MSKKIIILHAVFVLITSIPISAINFSSYLKGGAPNNDQMLSSVMYIVFWGIYGFLLGMRGLRFVKFSTYYWGIGTLLFFVSRPLLVPFIPIAIILAGPLYGLNYFYVLPSQDAMIVINILTVYAFSMLGYLLGKGSGKVFHNS